MKFLLTLVCTFLAVLVLNRPIRKAPVVFYVLAIALDVLLFANGIYDFPKEVHNALMVLMKKGGLAVSMFVVVMYIGVFRRNGWLSSKLRPIRAELSIIACLLIVGHMATYLSSYLPRLLGGVNTRANVMAGFIIALCLLVLLVVLGVTSFRFVKKHMKARSWKKLQSLAYIFYAFVFVHLLLMLGPSALHGNSTAISTVAVYSVVFVAYIILRIIRAVADRKASVDLAETVRDQGFVK